MTSLLLPGPGHGSLRGRNNPTQLICCDDESSPPRQHGQKDRVTPPEVMIERGSCVEAREPHQRIAEPTVDVAQRKAELRRLRKPGLNVTQGKQRERVAPSSHSPTMAVTGTRTGCA